MQIEQQNFHIAQFNVARMLAPLDDPLMQDFVNALQPINAIADGSPGFVWRLKDDSGDATAIQAFADETILINMSVWSTLEALKSFVYESNHLTFLRDKNRWFMPYGKPNLVLWWVEQDKLPTLADGTERLEMLSRDGPGPQAFTFANVYPPNQGED